MADKELKTTWVDNNIVVTGSDEATNKLIAELIAKKLAEPTNDWHDDAEAFLLNYFERDE